MSEIKKVIIIVITGVILFIAADGGMSDIMSFFVIFTLGVIFIIAGIKGWEFPGVYIYIRSDEYGEIINMVVMVGAGICVIIGSFYLFFSEIVSIINKS